MFVLKNIQYYIDLSHTAGVENKSHRYESRAWGGWLADWLIVWRVSKQHFGLEVDFSKLAVYESVNLSEEAAFLSLQKSASRATTLSKRTLLAHYKDLVPKRD